MLIYVFAIAVLLNISQTQFTNDCFDYNNSGKWGCFLLPNGCNNTNCQFIVKWQDQPLFVNFQLATKIDTSIESAFRSYTAIGFSNDQLMGDDSVSLCRTSVYEPSMVAETYYNDHYRSDVLNPFSRSAGILNYSVSISNQFLLCNFTRLKSLDGVPKFFNLSNPYYILVANGATNSLASPIYHHDNAFASSAPQSFQSLKSASYNFQSSASQQKDNSVQLKKAHSCIMIFAWLLFASTGILVARYCKFMFYSKICCFNRFWFTTHRSIMIILLIMIILAFLLILYEANWKWISQDDSVRFAHSIIGIICISLTIIQGVIGFSHSFLRIDKSGRKILHGIHRSIGISAYILAIVTIFLGVCMSEMNLGQNGWGIMIGWSIWSILLPIIIEIITIDIENLNESKADQIDETNPQREEIINSNLKAFRGKFNRIKSVLMVIHVLVAIGLSIALVVLISNADVEAD